MSNKHYPNDTPFQMLDCEAAFKKLSKQEKLYAHFISRAACEGQFITMFQCSHESPLIFILLDRILRAKALLADTLACLQEDHGFSPSDVKAFLIYASAFMANGGNYRGFGNSKFIPDIPAEKLTSVARDVLPTDEMQFFNQHCIGPMMDYSEHVRSLALPVHGVTTYWSANCNDNDARVVTEFLSFKKVESWNYRVFKTPSNEDSSDKDIFEVRFASRQLTTDFDLTPENLIGLEEEYKGKQFRFARGDYSDLMARIICNLRLACDNGLNDEDRLTMLDFIKHFETGSLEAHKSAIRHWVSNKRAVIESYIGFLHTYRDPVGTSAEFRSFVVIANKENAKNLGELANYAQRIIESLMPWPKEFEKDTYLQPDFKAVDIINFCSKGVPLGVNLPNYDDIRQDEGSKNVSVGQNITAKLGFFSKEDARMAKRYRKRAFEMQVTLHEYFGHGSGKLFYQRDDGTWNFDRDKTINPLTNAKVTSFYRPGETFNSVFMTIASSYEECRAECVGLYLCTFRNVLKLFKHEGHQARDITYVNWLLMIYASLKGLEVFNLDTGLWGQPQAQAHFVILRMLLEEAVGLVEINIVTNEQDGKPDLVISLDRSAIETTGKKAIGDFLSDLQVYKSTADADKARKMYLDYSEVKETSSCGYDFVKIREIVMARKMPRMMLVQSNTRLNETTGEVDLVSYDASAEGFVKSWIDRYPEPGPLYDILKKLYIKDMKHFPLAKK